MALDLVKEKWSNAVATVTIGSLKNQGGTRSSLVRCGGEEGLPFCPRKERLLTGR